MKVVKVSPQGQITIPKKARDLCKSGAFAMEITSAAIVLRPIEIRVIKDELEDFSRLAEKSFDFWDSVEDDIYQDYYSKN